MAHRGKWDRGERDRGERDRGERRRPTAIAWVALAGLTALSGLTVAVPAEAAEPLPRFANGIRATVHTPEDITSRWIVWEKDGPVLVHPSVGRVPLQDDAAVRVPFDPVIVEQAVRDVRGFVASLDAEIFILPATPRAVAGSFARRGAVLLAPGIGPVDPGTASGIVTHELGHVLTWACLDGRSGRWEAYLALRGLDAVANGQQARHADRAREILAEDIRFLFGGPLANLSGTIENHDLTTPDRIAGLADLLAGFFEDSGARRAAALCAAYPNPCNPMTTVELALPQDGSQQQADADHREAVLRIYDVRGALVRTVGGGLVANGRAAVCWDGTDERGNAAASGHYLCVMTLGTVVGRGAVTLVR